MYLVTHSYLLSDMVIMGRDVDVRRWLRFVQQVLPCPWWGPTKLHTERSGTAGMYCFAANYLPISTSHQSGHSPICLSRIECPIASKHSAWIRVPLPLPTLIIGVLRLSPRRIALCSEFSKNEKDSFGHGRPFSNLDSLSFIPASDMM